MKKRVIDKLKSSSGESIAETLVAVLIAAFALLMLAGTVNTSSNLITKYQGELQTYYEHNNDLAGPYSETLTISVKKSNATSEDSALLETKVSGCQVTSNIGNKTLIAYR